jgi:hypothetical protein
VAKLLEYGEDSRLKGYANCVTHAVLPLARTYCCNCGKPWGWASQESSEQIAAAEIVVFCEDCFEALNAKARGAAQAETFERIPPDEMMALGLIEENTVDENTR